MKLFARSNSRRSLEVLAERVHRLGLYDVAISVEVSPGAQSDFMVWKVHCMRGAVCLAQTTGPASAVASAHIALDQAEMRLHMAQPAFADMPDDSNWK